MAERYDLVDALFRLVLAQSCEQLTRWTLLPGGSEVRVAVNVSPGQLSSPQLPLLFAAELACHDLAGNRLVLEITETGADRQIHQRRCLSRSPTTGGYGSRWTTSAPV